MNSRRHSADLPPISAGAGAACVRARIAGDGTAVAALRASDDTALATALAAALAATHRHLLTFVLIVFAALFAQAASASQFERFGDLEVHYIVFNTTDLSPEMAERYGLTRSADLGLINLSGRRVTEDGTTNPVRLELEGSVSNLLGQSQPLEFREIEESGAIYYLESVRFTDRETLRFDVRVTDTETGRHHDIQFSKVLWRQ